MDIGIYPGFGEGFFKAQALLARRRSLDQEWNVDNASRLISSGVPIATGFIPSDSCSRRCKVSSSVSGRTFTATVAIGFLSELSVTVVYSNCQHAIQCPINKLDAEIAKSHTVNSLEQEKSLLTAVEWSQDDPFPALVATKRQNESL
jgi:hypothetical protein